VSFSKVRGVRQPVRAGFARLRFALSPLQELLAFESGP
jgi:hypothetical protein